MQPFRVPRIEEHANGSLAPDRWQHRAVSRRPAMAQPSIPPTSAAAWSCCSRGAIIALNCLLKICQGASRGKNRVCRRLDVGKYLNCTAACAGVLRDDTWNCEVPAQQADLTSSSSSFRLIVRQPSPHKFMSHQISNKIFERFRKCRANDDDGVRFDDEDDETFSSTPRLIKTPL